MRIVNMAHGSYFMLGGYLGLTVALRTRSFAMAVLAATVAIALVGMAMERVFLRRLHGQDLGQVLMTIGFALIFQDLALLIWGRARQPARCRGGQPARRAPRQCGHGALSRAGVLRAVRSDGPDSRYPPRRALWQGLDRWSRRAPSGDPPARTDRSHRRRDAGRP